MITAIVSELVHDEQGTSAVEMGLICALIVLVMLSALQGFANQSETIWNDVATKVANSNHSS